MEALKFTKDHLWIRVEGGHAKIGISEHGQLELGEITAVQLPELGDAVEKGEAFGELESKRTVADLIAPVTGVVTSINIDLEDSPSLVNDDPHHDGWLLEVDMSDIAELEDLMDADDYESLVADADS